MIKGETPCPCMSDLSYTQCCHPYHEKLSKPDTAEQLMRSRYTAYYLGLVDYLVLSTHPDKLSPNYRNQLESTKDDTDWTGLEVLATSMGMKADKIGKVHFKALYTANDKEYQMEEHSRFRRYQGGWVYYDDKG